ncbi:sensor histidine kinase [Empedobacter brevis]|uniref:sensor histidine kinase n=1 Tax=Empedobacter brevis TaxID=247 RepID=UPI0023F47DD7|nr:HAMP domain-containing sensor histidine kinase [Empedobacter brevis]
MRLSQKITQYLIVVVFCSMVFGFFIFYFAIERATNQSAVGKLENLNKIIEKKLQNKPISDLEDQHPHVKIKILDGRYDSLTKEVIRNGDYEWDDKLQTMVNHLTVTTYPFVNGVHYQIESQLSLTIIDDKFFVGILMVIAWIFVFVIISIIFFGELISRKLYTPFYYLIDRMKRFDLKENQKIKIVHSDIHELNQLNDLFLKTSQQSIEHYNALKEFSQNLSHELQTPMANMKAKIELMLNEELSETQMQSLSGMYDDINKVSAINRSLILLMSLEYHEVTIDKINLTDLIKEMISEQEDLMLMNGVELTLNLVEDVEIKMNTLLAHIVFNNLISNANRHNCQNGKIVIELTKTKFIIRNTGYEQEFTNETIFQRFNKSKYNKESIGLGLALVKKILNVYNFEIKYKYKSNWHQFTIDLKS